MNTLKITPSNGVAYDIIIKNGNISSIGSYVKEVFFGEKIFIISDLNVAKHYFGQVQTSLTDQGYKVSSYFLKPGESSKTLSNLEKIYKSMIEKSIARSDLIVALGGGVVGDIAGFAAATYLRGIDFIQIPTSLLAQVDSSVGGKVAVDLEEGKNLVGAFYHPKRVIIDPNVLDTLDQRFYRDGMAEVIKYGLLFDQLFLEDLELMLIDRNEIIYKCCEIKAGIVEADEFDRGMRMFLNFGHTLGHAIEAFYKYDKYTHGEAVAVGMYNITALSEKKGLTEVGVAKRIKKILKSYNLPWEFPKSDKEGILKNIKKDKKNLDGALNLALIKKVGEPFLFKTDNSFFKEL